VRVGGERVGSVGFRAGCCRVVSRGIENFAHAVQGFPSVFGGMGVRLSVWIISYQIVNDFMEETG
jgi:hypothetical protein